MISDILASIAWSIGLTTLRCQVITSTNPDLLKPLLKPSLTHWDQNQMEDISRTAFQIHFHYNTYLGDNWQKVSTGWVNDLVLTGDKPSLKHFPKCWRPQTIVAHTRPQIMSNSFEYWLNATPVPGHYLNQSWLIVNWILINTWVKWTIFCRRHFEYIFMSGNLWASTKIKLL